MQWRGSGADVPTRRRIGNMVQREMLASGFNAGTEHPFEIDRLLQATDDHGSGA